MSKINIIPIFVPHLGCPNDCVFCNQRRITGITEFNFNDAVEKIEHFLKLFEDPDKDVELAFYGGSFTAINRELQNKLLNIAKEYKDKEKINRIRISTRPDCIDEEILNNLKTYSVDIIELGIQSLDETVLKESKRGHDVKSVYDAVSLIKQFNFTLGLQQMVGLPADTSFKSIETAKKIIELKPNFVRIYPTLVIKNTELEDMYKSSKYKALSLEDAVDTVTKLIILYESENVNIIRVGLQSTTNLSFDKDVVAGPLHDAFRELCESNKLLEILKYSTDKINWGNNIEIHSNNKINSLLVGQNGRNKKEIIELLSVQEIKFYGSNKDENIITIKDDDNTLMINIDTTIKNIVKGW